MLAQLLTRMLGAAKLDNATYEEVEHDTTATGQAVLVVAIVSVCAGVGVLGVVGPLGIIWGILLGILGWALFAWLAYVIGGKLLAKPETHADWGQVARGLGFARSAGVLYLLGLLGFLSAGLGAALTLAVTIWIIVASVISLRHTLDYGSDWLRAVIVAVLAYIPYIVVQALISALA